jgi:hypothetical protein
MTSPEKATSRGVSLFQMHLEIIEECARERRMRGNTFSPAVQFILEEWRDLRQMLALLPESQRQELRQRLVEQRTTKGEQMPPSPTL